MTSTGLTAAQRREARLHRLQFSHLRRPYPGWHTPEAGAEGGAHCDLCVLVAAECVHTPAP